MTGLEKYSRPILRDQDQDCQKPVSTLSRPRPRSRGLQDWYKLHQNVWQRVAYGVRCLDPLESLREGREERRIKGGREVASGLDPQRFMTDRRHCLPVCITFSIMSLKLVHIVMTLATFSVFCKLFSNWENLLK